MGNLDLIFIINEFAFLVRGKEYDNRSDAIEIATRKWLCFVQNVRNDADFPEEIEGEIKSIKIYEINLKEKKEEEESNDEKT